MPARSNEWCHRLTPWDLALANQRPPLATRCQNPMKNVRAPVFLMLAPGSGRRWPGPWSNGFILLCLFFIQNLNAIYLTALSQALN